MIHQTTSMFFQIIFVANLFMTIANGQSRNYPECFDEIKYEKSYDVEWNEEFETVCETKYKYIAFYLCSFKNDRIQKFTEMNVRPDLNKFAHQSKKRYVKQGTWKNVNPCQRPIVTQLLKNYPMRTLNVMINM